jgi:hypothetical protein
MEIVHLVEKLEVNEDFVYLIVVCLIVFLNGMSHADRGWKVREAGTGGPPMLGCALLEWKFVPLPNLCFA